MPAVPQTRSLNKYNHKMVTHCNISSCGYTTVSNVCHSGSFAAITGSFDDITCDMPVAPAAQQRPQQLQSESQSTYGGSATRHGGRQPAIRVEDLAKLNRPLTKAEKRRQRRATAKYRILHASRERVRVEAFNTAFAVLRARLPTLPADKKLSKIEILRLSIAYVAYLADLLKCDLQSPAENHASLEVRAHQLAGVGQQ